MSKRASTPKAGRRKSSSSRKGGGSSSSSRGASRTESLEILVLDLGTMWTRFGRATDAEPHVIRTLVSESLVEKLRVGEAALQSPSVTQVRGERINNWAGVTEILTYALKILSMEARRTCLVFAEPLWMDKAERQNLEAVVLDGLKFARLQLVVAPECVLDAYGISNGVGVCLGAHLLQSIFLSKGSGQRGDYRKVIRADLVSFGGNNVDLSLCRSLTESGISTSDSLPVMEQVRSIRESKCFVALDFEAEGMAAVGGKTPPVKVNWVGDDLELTTEVFRCYEPLFEPNLLGADMLGLSVSILNTVLRCSDQEMQKTLAANVMIAGGLSQAKGLLPRLEKDLATMSPKHLSKEWKLTVVDEAGVAVWKGARNRVKALPPVS